MKQPAGKFGKAPIRSARIHGKRVSVVDKQVIVQLKHGLAQDAEAQASVLRELPVDSEVKQQFDETGMAVIALPEDANLGAVVERLSLQTSVDYAEPNLIDSI